MTSTATTPAGEDRCKVCGGPNDHEHDPPSTWNDGVAWGDVDALRRAADPDRRNPDLWADT